MLLPLGWPGSPTGGEHLILKNGFLVFLLIVNERLNQGQPDLVVDHVGLKAS